MSAFFFYTAVALCEDPGQILHATRNGTTGPLPIGSVLTYTCHAGYHGGRTITCGYWATWSTLTLCQPTVVVRVLTSIQSFSAENCVNSDYKWNLSLNFNTLCKLE